ncbi:hypothetical protein F5Y03DRAFT_337319 [Xylaria venustula]|nr:hypothetical protein F5Y03DRAFT_337319 [Xylaria venustula]
MASPFKREDNPPEPCISTETVTLRSPTGTEFVLHARPLAHLSSYFRTGLNSEFQEATTRVFDLKEHCDDKVLQAFTNWVYLRSSGVDYDVDEVPFLSRLCQATTVKAWLFGEYICAPAFQNTMMKLMVNVHNEKFDRSLFKRVGESSLENSPIEKYLVDRFCSLLFHYNEHCVDAVMVWSTPRLKDKVCKKLSEKIWHKSTRVGKKFNDFSVGKAEEYEVKEIEPDEVPKKRKRRWVPIAVDDSD